MSRLEQLVKDAQRNVSLVERAYGSFPISVAQVCGAEEVRDAIEWLDRLAAERRKLPEWDGDASDDLWRVQKGLSELLGILIARFPAEVAASLVSKEEETRTWGARAMNANPSAELIVPLKEALALEQEPLAAKVMKSALSACRKKRNWLSRLLKQ